MAKVGLKDTLTLLAKGYTKKDIDALAAIDEEAEGSVPGDNADINPSAPIITDSVPAPDEDLKAQLDAKQKELEELQAQLKTNDEKLKKVQQENIHQNSAPMAEEQKKQQNDSLLNLVRGFM